VVVSARGLAAGKIEIKPRAGKEVAQAPLEGAADCIAAMCGE